MEYPIKNNWLVLSSFLILVILISISPNLIASIGLLTLVTYIIFNIQALSINTLKNEYFYILFFLILLSLANCVFLNASNDVFTKSIKALLLILPVLITYYLIRNNEKVLFNQKNITLISYTFLIASIVCLFQLLSEELLKNLLKGSETSASELAAKSNNFINAFVVFVWCYLAIINNIKNKFYYLPILLIVFAIFLGFSEAAKTSLIISFLIYCLFFIVKERIFLIIKIFIVLSVLCVFTLPSLVIDNKEQENISKIINRLDSSALHRIDIWDRSIELIKEKPFLGHGTSNAGKLVESNESTFFDINTSRDHFLYPHNIYLQITLEFGILGLCWLLFLLSFLINAIAKLDKNIQPYACAMFIAILTIFLFSIPIWRSWWLVYIVYLAMCIKLTNRNTLITDSN